MQPETLRAHERQLLSTADAIEALFPDSEVTIAGIRQSTAALVVEVERFTAELEGLKSKLGGSTAASSGADLIAAERQRQVDAEGWTPEHDDAHSDGELATAACCYATDPKIRANIMLTPDGEENVNRPGSGYDPRHWPAEWTGWWKPSPDRVRELVKAGALIAAEIDRLQRLTPTTSEPGSLPEPSPPASPLEGHETGPDKPPGDDRSAVASSEDDSVHACLCCVCGAVSLASEWTYWQRDDEGEHWIPNRPGQNDPMELCPACKWEHQDTDDGSGVYQGTLPEMRAQRARDLPGYASDWAHRLAEISGGQS